MFRKRIITTAILALQMQPVCWVQAAELIDGVDRDLVSRFTDALESVRKRDYGNTHLTLKIVEHEHGRSEDRVLRLEYWSRDAEYFRVDRTILRSPAPEEVGRESRRILRPEGYVLLVADAPGKPMAVSDFGPYEQGFEIFGGSLFFWASTRATAVLPVENLFQATFETGGRGVLKNVSINGEILTIETVYTNADHTTNSFAQCNLDLGVCERYTAEIFKKGELHQKRVVEKRYTPGSHRGIPVYHSERVVATGGPTKETVLTVESISWDPVPFEVFSLGAQGLGSPASSAAWMRRGVILVIGLAMVSIYVVYRRRSRRA